MSIPGFDYWHRAIYGGPTTATLTTSSATAGLTVGRFYRCACASAWRFRQGAAATVTATLDDLPVGANDPIHVYAGDSSTDGIAGILSSGTATLVCAPLLG